VDGVVDLHTEIDGRQDRGTRELDRGPHRMGDDGTELEPFERTRRLDHLGENARRLIGGDVHVGQQLLEIWIPDLAEPARQLERRELEDLDRIAELVRAALHQCRCDTSLFRVRERMLDLPDPLDQSQSGLEHARCLVHASTLDQAPRPGPRQRNTRCGQGARPSSRFLAADRAVSFASIVSVARRSSEAPAASTETEPSSTSVARPLYVASGV
jgi:hypothetical protein